MPSLEIIKSSLVYFMYFAAMITTRNETRAGIFISGTQ